jgi:hypothetical protein
MGQSLPYIGGWATITGVLYLLGRNGDGWLPLVIWIPVSIAIYVGSLFTNPDRRCWGCNGKSRFFGTVFGYASRACKYCGGSGRRPRWGTKFISGSNAS